MVAEEGKELSLVASCVFILSFIVVESYFISPAYFIYKFEHNYIKINEVPFLQIFFNTLNCAIYVSAAISESGDFQNLLTNSVGLVICLFILLRLWLVLFKNNKTPGFFIYLLIIINIIFQISYLIYRLDDDEGKLTQYFATVINICMYLVLNQNDISAYKEKRADKIPILSCILGLISSIGWFLYAYANQEKQEEEKEETQQSDVITFYANLFSFIILIFPITEYFILFCKYKKNENRNDDDLLSGDKKYLANEEKGDEGIN